MAIGESLDFRVPDASGFGHPAESLSCCLPNKKVTKEEGHPTSGSGLRPDSPRSGAAPGARHEGTSLSLRDSLGVLPRVPLCDTSTRPPDGELGPSRLEGREADFAALCAFPAQPVRPHQPPLSGGRVESLRKGASGMDAVRGVKGQGRPFTPAPGATMERGNPGAAGAGCRGKRFWLLLPRLAKVTRPAGRKQALKPLANHQDSKTYKPHDQPYQP